MEPTTFAPPARPEPNSTPAWAFPEPPSELDEELKLSTDDVLATLSGDRWLFPPCFGPAEGVPADFGGVRDELAAEEWRGAGPPPVPPLPVDVAPPAHERGRPQMEAMVHEYEFETLRSEAAQKVVMLLFSASGQPSRDSRAAKVLSNLKAFTTQAYRLLTTQQSGISENERQMLTHEARLAMQAMVRKNALCISTDCILCLEAFEICRGRPGPEQSWLGNCIANVLQGAAAIIPDQERFRWQADLQRRIQNEPELYANLDVRSWPCILSLAGATEEILDAEAFKRQIRLQLCIAHDYTRYEGLLVAAKLIAELRQAANFGAESIGDIFNDRHFDSSSREKLLAAVLQGAPRSVIQEVLRKIDGDDVDVAERNDEEIILVRALLQKLNEDIRCCKHAYFRMKNDWIAGRWGGVVSGEELSPEQICDHIEDEDNHNEHLKAAVNKCLKLNRKFEAARMLARPASKDTSVFESNRNDKQLAYLVSLYNDLEPPDDVFGPVEEGCLALPVATESGNIMYIDDAGGPLMQLTADLLDNRQPTVVGVWWCWRCFDHKLDLWPKASFVSLAYNGKLAIVDFMGLERRGAVTESQGKGALCDILTAPHLLKVTHDLDSRSLKVLQRALVPLVNDGDSPPEDPGISPLLDLTIVAAFVRRTRPGMLSISKLSGLTFDYLRLELCLAEALSNFERRPLRQSQRHYALALAWSPVMVLRVLCAYEVVTLSQVTSMCLGFADAPERWDEILRKEALSSDPAAEREYEYGEQSGLAGAYGENLWDDSDWVAGLTRPDQSFDISASLRRSLGTMVLPPEHAQSAKAALSVLFDRGTASQHLVALYEAFHVSQAGKHGDN